MAPPLPRFVSYLRVSTDGQGRSGLGLEAQRQAVAAYVAQAGGEMVVEFREVESGKRADRPQLAAALASCRTRRAVLVIAKLDRLARNARFLLSVVEGSGDAGVVFCDLPTVPAGPVGKFLITQMAAVAELEAGLISQRTRAALAVAKGRGVRLGNPSPTPATAAMAAAARQARSRQVVDRATDMLAVLHQVQAEGVSGLRAIAAELHARGVLTPAGKAQWSPEQVRRLLTRGEAASAIAERACLMQILRLLHIKRLVVSNAPTDRRSHDRSRTSSAPAERPGSRAGAQFGAEPGAADQ